jgi:hypothetical protein
MAQFDFRTQVQDPFASAMRAVQLGSSLQQAQVQRQQAGVQQQALQQALEQKAKFQRGVDKILQGGVENAKAEDFAELALYTDKDTLKSFKTHGKALIKTSKRKRFNLSLRWFLHWQTTNQKLQKADYAKEQQDLEKLIFQKIFAKPSCLSHRPI